MLDAILKISAYTEGMDEPAFSADLKTVDAVVRNLEIIGEASRSIPENLYSLYTDADWRRIGEMRNKLIHDYAGTNVGLVWQTLIGRLDALETSLRDMLAKLDD